MPEKLQTVDSVTELVTIGAKRELSEVKDLVFEAIPVTKRRMIGKESWNPETGALKSKKRTKRVKFYEPDKLERVKFFVITDSPADPGLTAN